MPEGPVLGIPRPFANSSLGIVIQVNNYPGNIAQQLETELDSQFQQTNFNVEIVDQNQLNSMFDLPMSVVNNPQTDPWGVLIQMSTDILDLGTAAEITDFVETQVPDTTETVVVQVTSR